MKIERSDIRVSKLNNAELIISCLEGKDRISNNNELSKWIDDMIYRYDPETGKSTLDPNRYSLQMALDGLTHKYKPEMSIEYEKSVFSVPQEVKEELRNAIAYKEEHLDYPFLTFSRIDYNSIGEKIYTECIYPTQENFFKELNDLYEDNVSRYYNSPDKILKANGFRENQQILHTSGEPITIGSAVEDVRINGNRVLDNTDIYSMINYVCNNYRDTEIYPWILGIKEIDIEGKNELLEMPGGIKTSFQEIQNQLDKDYAQSKELQIYWQPSEMINPPTNENESDWKIINYLGKYENSFNDKAIFILKNNEPVHAFLIGSENLYTKEEEEIVKNLVEDYIVKQVYYNENAPMRINMEKYEMMGQVLNGSGMRAFTVPTLEIYQEQERIKEKNQVVFNIPEKPTGKDFVKDLKNLMTEYEKKGVSQKNLNQILTQIFNPDGGKAR